uniref:Uncharacterized protein n=1 Tax=Pinguiococcus pyrenoidosus TaxID=172671 RepID=A0A7R9UBQ8_9STRA|mmetsp:Transcript_3683/g.14478  ORF Transcript_3683/g.14478 Transcript_3683/m.14478 type:complete len:374 (+) Transcript_3683:71-1192(+)
METQPMDASHPVSKLVAGGENAMHSAEPELALRFFQRALEQQSDHEAALDGAAGAMLSLGDADGARALLRRGCELRPESSPLRWLDLAQLLEGADALAAYSKAVSLLMGRLQGAADAQTVRKQICSAKVSVAELYMTDLCTEKGAEEACERSLREAQQFDEGAPELPQALASLRLSQNRQQEAALLALEASERTQKLIREVAGATTALAALQAGEDAQADVPVGPELELRISLTKILIECASQAVIEEGGHGGLCGKCAERAAEVIHGCLEEDEDNVEQWFLLGCAAQLMVPPDLTVARDAFRQAQQMLGKIRDAFAELGEDFPYEEQEAAVQRQQALLPSQGDGEPGVREEQGNAMEEVAEADADARPGQSR